MTPMETASLIIRNSQMFFSIRNLVSTVLRRQAREVMWKYWWAK
jgi:hypothetical protein